MRRAYLGLMLGTLLLAACSQAKPEADFEGNVVSIAYLRNLYRGAPLTVGGERSVTGVVVSSDSCGNFYKELVIQDQTGGIFIRLDAGDLYRTYPPGTTVTVRCHDLTLGSYGGRLELGGAPDGSGYETSRIPAGRIATTVIRTRQPIAAPAEAILPAGSLTTGHIGSRVEIAGRLLPSDGPNASWSGNRWFRTYPYDETADSLLVRTAERASFAGDPLPAEPVTLRGILSWWGRDFQLILLSPEDVIP